MRVRRTLVFPAGTEVGLEIHQALKDCKEVMLFGAGQATSNPAAFIYDNYHVLPSIHEGGWLQALIKLCKELEIEYIFPAYDDVIVALAKHQQDIPATVLTAPLAACLVTRSKILTYKLLASVIRVPQVYSVEEVKSFPVFVKPNRGQGSQDAIKIDDKKSLNQVLNKLDDPIISEFLPGEEYTVDCFSDRERGVLFSGARIRLRMRNGIAVHTRSVSLDGVEEIAAKIHEILNLRGAWFFQLKRAKDGELTLLEVAPRIAGSMSTHRVKGVNFPLLTIFEHERLPLRFILLQDDVELDRTLQNRYRLNLSYEALYIDLDDTLIIRDKVNLDALRLIYSCINRKISVTLITRHLGNLSEKLKKHRLNNLFDDVIHLDSVQNKSDFIKTRNAIFVDDSFAERRQVFDDIGIPTFDCSMIEALIANHP